MRPFDLDAAKRGEPIQLNTHLDWTTVPFIGMTSGGNVVFERSDGSIGVEYIKNVRMAPRKVVRWMRAPVVKNNPTFISGVYQLYHSQQEACESWKVVARVEWEE